MRNEVLVVSDVVELQLAGSSWLLVVLCELVFQMLLAREWLHKKISRLHYVMMIGTMQHVLHIFNATNVNKAQAQ